MANAEVKFEFGHSNKDGTEVTHYWNVFSIHCERKVPFARADWLISALFTFEPWADEHRKMASCFRHRLSKFLVHQRCWERILTFYNSNLFSKRSSKCVGSHEIPEVHVAHGCSCRNMELTPINYVVVKWKGTKWVVVVGLFPTLVIVSLCPCLYPILGQRLTLR